MKDTLDGYKDWLLDIMIRCGVGVISNTNMHWRYLNEATFKGHIVYGDDEDFNFIAYTLTPTAVNYLKENE
jgi:hypothetical protein